MSPFSETPEPGGRLKPKQRYELERWARLNGMSLQQFLKTHQAAYSKSLQERRENARPPNPDAKSAG